MANEEKKEKREKKKAPSITVNARGRIGKLLETLAKLYEASHEGRSVRWVYAPEHKPDLSNVMEMRMEGYEIVRVEDLDADDLMFGRESSDVVRVGDVVLMSTDADNKMARIEENMEQARDQRKLIEREFYEEQERAEVAARGGGTHRASPRGRVTVEDREVILNRDQSSE